MDQQPDHNESIKKLGEMIKGIRITMMTTAEDNGRLRSRPMATQQTDFDGELWFFTGASSPKVEEVQQDQHVNLSYADPGSNRYVSLSGTAQLVRDKEKAKELWNPFVKAWFPKGVDDPELALLRVTVEEAEYWDSPDSKVVQLAGLAKALITGKPIKGGENEKIDIEQQSYGYQA